MMFIGNQQKCAVNVNLCTREYTYLHVSYGTASIYVCMRIYILYIYI